MKKVRLTESQLITLIKKIVKEQSVVNGPSECLEEHIRFMFEKSELDGREVVGGGDLVLWNKSNEIPDPSDKAAYNRFVKLLKEYIDDNFFGFEECEGVTFEEIKPFIKDMYLAEIEKRSLSAARTPSEVLSDLIGSKNIGKFRREIAKNLKITYNDFENNLDDYLKRMPGLFKPETFNAYFANILVSERLSDLFRGEKNRLELNALIAKNYSNEIEEFRKKLLENYNNRGSFDDVKAIIDSKKMSDSVDTQMTLVPRDMYGHQMFGDNYWAEQVIDNALGDNGIDLENYYYDAAIDYAKEIYGPRLGF